MYNRLLKAIGAYVIPALLPLVMVFSSGYTASALAYDYLQAADGLYQVLASKPYSDEEKTKIYKVLVIFLPVIREYLNELQTSRQFSLQDLQVAVVALFEELSLQPDTSMTAQQIFEKINAFFEAYALAPRNIKVEQLPEFIIVTTSIRIFGYVASMMSGNPSFLKVANAVYRNELRLLHHYDTIMVVNILQQLNQHMLRHQQKLIEKLDVDSEGSILLTCRAIMMLEQLLQELTSNKKLAHSLKVRLMTALLDYHMEKVRHHGDKLQNLMRLTIGIYEPDFCFYTLLVAPQDYPEVRKILTAYGIYLYPTLPDWLSTPLPSLRFQHSTPLLATELAGQEEPENKEQETADIENLFPQVPPMALTWLSDAADNTVQAGEDSTPSLADFFQQKQTQKETDEAAARAAREKKKHHHRRAARFRRERHRQKKMSQEKESSAFPDLANPLEARTEDDLAFDMMRAQTDREQAATASHILSSAATGPEVTSDESQTVSPVEPHLRSARSNRIRSKAGTGKQVSITPAAPAAKPSFSKGNPGKKQPRKNKAKSKQQKHLPAPGTGSEHKNGEPTSPAEPVATDNGPSDPGEDRATATRKHQPPRKLELNNYDSMALSFLNKMLTLMNKCPKRMALIGLNGGQILLRDLYGHKPAFERIWDFTATERNLYDDFLKSLKIVLANPRASQSDYGYKIQSLEGVDIIVLDRKLESGLTRELITFRLHYGKKKQQSWRNSVLSPYKLSMPTSERQLDLLAEMFRVGGALSVEYHNFLHLWRQLETAQPALSRRESEKLFQLGRHRVIHYGENPVRDQAVGYLLPTERAEDQYHIGETDAIPEELLCPACKRPSFHALKAPCGNKLCRACIRSSSRDASGRLLCIARGCQGAHYPMDYQRDSHTIKALREYADPGSLSPVPADPYTVLKTLAVLDKERYQLRNALTFHSLRRLGGGEKLEGSLDTAEARQDFRKNLEAVSVEEIPEDLYERYDQLMQYYNAVTKFAFSHHFLLHSARADQERSGEEPSERESGEDPQQIIHNLLDHTYDLVIRELELLDALIASETPGGLEQFLAHVIIMLDSAMVHIDLLPFLEPVQPGTEPVSRPHLLTDLSRAFYPELISGLKHLQENQLLVTAPTEPQQQILKFILRVILVLFPSMLESPQHNILFGPASNMEKMQALQHHVSLVSSMLSPFEHHYYWVRLLPVLMDMGEQAFPSGNTAAYPAMMNRLAKQLQAFSHSLAREMVYYPIPAENPGLDCMITLLDYLLSDFFPCYSAWAGQVSISDKSADDVHPWIRAPEALKDNLAQTRQTLLDNKARADQVRQEQEKSWDTEHQERLARNLLEREKLTRLRRHAESDNGADLYPIVWEGAGLFFNHLDALERTASFSLHLKHFHNFVAPAVSLADYQHADPCTYLDITRKLLNHANVLYEPMMSIMNCYSRAMQVFLNRRTEVMLLESLDQVELMEASSKHLKRMMIDIQDGLNESHQSIATWLNARVEFSYEMLPLKLMAQIADQMQQARQLVNGIIRQINMFSGWLESWGRVVDTNQYPIPPGSARQDKRDLLNIYNHLPGEYKMHWVAPDGNCLYSALLMGATPGYQHPAPEQTTDFRHRLHQLLKTIVAVIEEQADPEKKKQYWQQFSTLLSLSQEDIMGLVSSGSTLASPDTALDNIPAHYGEMAFIAPLAIIELNTSVSFMDISDPLAPEDWVQHHENIFSVWLHNAPQLLNALIEADVIDLTQIQNGAELSLALFSENPEIIQQTVEQYSITSSPFIIIHTGSSHNPGGHFFGASAINPRDRVEDFKHYLEQTLGVPVVQLQSATTSTAMAALMIMKNLKQ